MSKDTSGPAFPVRDMNEHPGPLGLSVRDYFAAHASDSDIKDQAEIMRLNGELVCLPDGWRVKARYMHADAMLSERAK